MFITESFLITSESIARFVSFTDVDISTVVVAVAFISSVVGVCMVYYRVLLTCVACSLLLRACVSMRVTVCTYKTEQQPRLASH